MNPSESVQKTRVLSILNLVGYLLVIIMNYLANALPINGQTTGEISARYPNLFTPAPYTFAIWGIIYILLLIFIIFQLYRAFSPGKSAAFIQVISYWFLISCIANAGWILAWHHERILLTVLIMIALFISLAFIYFGLGIGHSNATNRERYLVHLPFSVYFAWINVALITNIAVVLVDAGWDRFGLPEQFWMFALVIIVIILAMVMLYSRRDIFFLAVIIWALAGILYKYMNDVVIADNATRILLMAGILLLLAAGIIRLFRKRFY